VGDTGGKIWRRRQDKENGKFCHGGSQKRTLVAGDDASRAKKQKKMGGGMRSQKNKGKFRPSKKVL